MKVHEYQAKELLAKYGVPVPRGKVATTPAEAKAVARELGVPVVVKAQIHAGGRGKGGGIKLAATPDEAEAAAIQILGMTLVTPQTGAEGKLVRSVLIEEQTPIEREIYLAALIDGSRGEVVGANVLLTQACYSLAWAIRCTTKPRRSSRGFGREGGASSGRSRRPWPVTHRC